MKTYKVSVTRVKVRGERRWRVRWTDATGVHRAWFGSEDAAAGKVAQIRKVMATEDQEWALMPVTERQRLLAAWREARTKGIDLLAMVTAPSPIGSRSATAPGLMTVIEEMVKVKETAGRDRAYVKGLKAICKRFAADRLVMPMDEPTVKDVEVFLDAHGIRYRSTLRSRLSTWFKFAMRRRYRLDNPCAQLETVTVPYIPPAIFSVAQTAACLKYLKKHPTLMGWFVLSTFAGLRPEEAQKSKWTDIHFDEGWVKVEAQTSKIRERRVVYPPALAMKLLQRAKKLKARLPLKDGAMRRGRKQLKKLLAFKVWPKDITRHSAASYWLADTGDIKLVAAALAHSEKTMRKHYLAIVTKAEAALFWKL